MGSMELLAIHFIPWPDRGQSRTEGETGHPKGVQGAFKSANWIRVRLHIKLPPWTEIVVKTRPNFQHRGLTVGNPRFKSNKELILLNNCQDQQRVSRGACIVQAQYTNYPCHAVIYSNSTLDSFGNGFESPLVLT